VFGGVYLRDVLEHVGLPADYAGAGVNHIHFVAVDEVQASIPSDKAMSPAGECMLLWADSLARVVGKARTHDRLFAESYPHSRLWREIRSSSYL